MSFLPITTDEALDPDARAARDRQLELHGGRITNMKATLLSHVPSFDAYMEWYPLRDALVPFIGERAVSLFSYAISDENDCLVCSVFFRKILIDSGEDPENPSVTDAEQLLIDFGRSIANSPGAIEPEFYARLEATFSPQLRVLLVAFAGQMVATNLFVTVGKIPLDQELYDYRKPGDDRT
jgi:hypothetical protein